MNIELLYIDDCINWQHAKRELEEVLVELGIQEEVRMVRVTSNEEAQRLSFSGSPTVRVNGLDVDPEAPSEGFNVECRIYWVGGRPVGRPPREWLARALAPGV